MNKLLILLATLLLLPLIPHAQAKPKGEKNSAKNTVVVEIDTSRGPASIPLVRKGDGFVGPRGEYYAAFPSKKTLEAVYGASVPKPGTNANTGELKVAIVSGGVNIRRNGKLLSEIRTKLPNVEGWKLIRENSAIVIKSGIGREPGIVELFDVKSGKRLDKIPANQVKDGKPGWAKNFAE